MGLVTATVIIIVAIRLVVVRLRVIIIMLIISTFAVKGLGFFELGPHFGIRSCQYLEPCLLGVPSGQCT